MRFPILSVPAVLLGIALLMAAGSTAEARGKVKLGDVAKQAAKPPSEQKVLGTSELSQTKTKSEPVETPEPDYNPITPEPDYKPPIPVLPVVIVEEIWTPDRYYYGSEVVSRRSADIRLRVGVVGRGGGLAASRIDQLGGGGVLIGAEARRWTLDLRGFYALGTFDRELDRSFHHLGSWSADLALRVWMTPPGTPLRTNLMVAGRLGRYDWDFRHPVQVAGPSSVREVGRDTLGFGAILSGVGMELVRGPGWAVTLTAAAGVQDFLASTGEGFENDLFGASAVLELSTEFVVTPGY